MWEEMRNIKLILSYDGTNYHGFQRQENACTIQELLEGALAKVTRERVRVKPAAPIPASMPGGRLSTHHSPIPAERFQALNSCLPGDIVVGELRGFLDFHARPRPNLSSIGTPWIVGSIPMFSGAALPGIPYTNCRQSYSGRPASTW